MAFKRSYGLISLLLLIGAVSSVYWIRAAETLPVDPEAAKIYAKADSVHSYQQNVDTEASVDNQTLYINGVYWVDDPRELYAFNSTTTVWVTAQKKPIVFTLNDVAIKKDVYVESTLLASYGPSLSIPTDGIWRHFTKGAIPKEYADVAIAGPLVDNLKLFGHGGKYLTLVRKWGPEQVDGTALSRYTFMLSEQATSTLPNTLGPLIERISKNGFIDAWVNDKSEIQQIRFRNKTYLATTTISHTNQSLSILPPPHAQ